MDLLDTSGQVSFFYYCVSVLVGWNGNGNDALQGANVMIIDRIAVKSKTRHNPI